MISMLRGFSLVEVLVAMGIVCSATLAIAELPMLAMRTNEIARRTTLAAALATQKIEQLQSAAWAELHVSPPFTLDRNSGGYCDFLDEHGRVIGDGDSPPSATAYVRRWGVEMAAFAPVLVIQVTVGPVSSGDATSRSRRAEEVRLVGVKARP
jgi:prepilin-type N-terminal cleavage/methylation domain-containing protein